MLNYRGPGKKVKQSELKHLKWFHKGTADLELLKKKKNPIRSKKRSAQKSLGGPVVYSYVRVCEPRIYIKPRAHRPSPVMNRPTW